MEKGNGIGSLHLPPAEQIRQLRRMVSKQQYMINEMLGKNELMQQNVNLCVILAYKNGGEITITAEDNKAIEGVKVIRHRAENGDMTYTIQPQDKQEEKKPNLELVK